MFQYSNIPKSSIYCLLTKRALFLADMLFDFLGRQFLFNAFFYNLRVVTSRHAHGATQVAPTGGFKKQGAE